MRMSENASYDEKRFPDNSDVNSEEVNLATKFFQHPKIVASCYCSRRFNFFLNVFILIFKEIYDRIMEIYGRFLKGL